MFQFYFKDIYTNDFLFDRIEIVVGDIKYKNLNLSEELYDKLGHTIDLVIHCAALVKHIGKYDEFKKMNLDGTKNIANFCMKYNTEEDFFIGQNYQENYYIKSKLLAEEYILQNIKQGLLKANIFRVGNLTSRYKDGVFQYNIDSNAFYNKLQFLLKNKFFYESSNMQEFDLSPVDEIANAIISIIFNYGNQNKIFHMMNPKKFNIQTLADNLSLLNYQVKIMKDTDFYKKIIKMDLDTNSLIINDYNLHTNISKLNIKLNCNITLKYLENIGFHYHKINSNYLSKIIEYFKNINFI